MSVNKLPMPAALAYHLQRTLPAERPGEFHTQPRVHVTRAEISKFARQLTGCRRQDFSGR